MGDREIVINSSNLREFNKYRWLLILFLLLWGGSLILFLFRLKWLLIIAFIAVYFSFRKAFSIEIRLEDDKIQIRKNFIGFAYRIIKISYSKVFFFPENLTLKFQGLNDALFIILENDGLKIQKNKLIDFICTKKEADLLIDKLNSELKRKGTYTEIRNLIK
jgi:hypothetical protein